MIEAIIFDFGNVICHFDNNIFLEGISKFTNKTVPELDELIYRKSGLPEKYEMGLITSDEFFERIVRLCALKMSKREFISAYTNIFTPISATFDLIKRLKPHYKMGMISNTSEWDFNYGIKPTSVFRLFDSVSLSFEVKVMKPDKKLFYDALQKLNKKPRVCVYIDDIEESVKAATQLGMHGIHYVSYPKLVDSLRKLDIDI